MLNLFPYNFLQTQNAGPSGPYLELSFTDFSEFPYGGVSSAGDLVGWNALFTSAYTDIVVDNIGYTVKLYGDSAVILFIPNITSLTGVYDTGTLFNVENACFSGCTALVNFSVSNTFNTDFLGPSADLENVFTSITGNTFSLTIPAGLMEANGPGAPDLDVAALIADNTVTVNTF